MSADSDYARVLAQLSTARLTPYVEYVTHDTLNGMGKSVSTSTVVVRVSDGKIVSGKENFTLDTDDYSHRDTNPVTAPIFDASCYRATSESSVSFDGEPAIRLSLAPICKERHHGDHDYAFTTLYVEPGTLRPLDAHADLPGDDDSKHVALSLDQRFTMAEGRVMPASMNVDVSGSGFMFWLQVHVKETYEQYRFLQSPP